MRGPRWVARVGSSSSSPVYDGLGRDCERADAREAILGVLSRMELDGIG